MAEGTVDTSQTQRRIIERPRLTRLLDESPARIKMLIAPAGYGKTTLARQWLSREGRQPVWIRWRSGAPDVAVVIAELVTAGTACGLDPAERTLARLRASADPAQEVDVLIDLLLEEQAQWPAEVWCAFDDYQELMTSPQAERAVELFVSRSAANVFITSRARPSWATARGILYGEILELGRRDLAMTASEVRATISGPEGGSATILEAADGWPALVGLAALHEGIDLPIDRISDEIFEYLAEEVLGQASVAAREAFTTTAFASAGHTDILRVLYPADEANEIEAEAVRAGLLVAGPSGNLEVHPLLQRVLRRICVSRGAAYVESATKRLWAIYAASGSWDDAFELVVLAQSPGLLEELIERAFTELLERGRLGTLRAWIAHAKKEGVDSASLRLAEAEIELRSGLLRRAETLAVGAAEAMGEGDRLRARAWYVAGQSAHLQGQERRALKHFAAAGLADPDPELLEMIRWGELVTSVDLEDPAARQIVERIARSGADTAESIVLRANALLLYSLRAGGVSEAITAGHAAAQVVDLIPSAFRRTGFWSAYAGALAVGAEYGLAERAATAFMDDVRANRIAFAVPHAYAALALAQLGQRSFEQARQSLEASIDAGLELNDQHAVANGRAIMGRLLMSVGRPDEAVEAMRGPALRDSISPGMTSELLATRALALARLGDTRYRELAEEAESLSTQVETRVLVPVAHAVFGSVTNEKALGEMARSAVDAAAELGSWDCFVVGYRAHPAFLIPLRGTECASYVLAVMERASDLALARKVGLARTAKGPGALSPREAEIHSLVSAGLTNAEIAARLVISESTVKLHVHHVFEKLGVRTRAAAAAQYRES